MWDFIITNKEWIESCTHFFLCKLNLISIWARVHSWKQSMTQGTYMKRVMDLVSRGLYGKMRWLSPHPCLRSQYHRCNSYIQFPRCLDRERRLHLEASSETVARHFRPGRRASPPSGADAQQPPRSAAAAVRPYSWPPKRSRRRRLVFPLDILLCRGFDGSDRKPNQSAASIVWSHWSGSNPR